MATIRVEKTRNYTVLSNRALDDKTLSLKALGLLVYMLRQPDEWDFTLEWLSKRHRDGLDSVRSALAELEKSGYVTRERIRSEDGTFRGVNYVVREVPCEPTLENPILVKPTTENPTSDNPTLLNTNIVNTNIITPIAPKGAEPEKNIVTWDPEMFDRFWKMYPKKKDKKKAIREWNRLKPDRQLMWEMSAALDAQMTSEEWQRDDGRAIPYPCRWLSHRRWEDELSVDLPAPKPTEREIEWL